MEIPVIVEAQEPKPVVEAGPRSSFIKATSIGLAFSVAFSSSFVIGYYWLGPVLDAARHMI